MTREEAIAEIERLLECAKKLQGPQTFVDFRPVPALEMALSALRPVSRERVEKVWSGCPYCKEDSDGYVQKFGAYSVQCGELTTGHCKPQKIKFCPHCSCPLTDESVDMMMERLEALGYGKDD